MRRATHRTRSAQGVQARCIGPGQYLVEIKEKRFSVTRERKQWWVDHYAPDGTPVKDLSNGPFRSMDKAVLWILDKVTGTSSGAAPGA